MTKLQEVRSNKWIHVSASLKVVALLIYKLKNWGATIDFSLIFSSFPPWEVSSKIQSIGIQDSIKLNRVIVNTKFSWKTKDISPKKKSYKKIFNWRQDASERQKCKKKLIWYLWNMQTSAMNCNLSLKADRLVKSPESCIFLVCTAISFNSFFIALCQNNISSIGCVVMVSETSVKHVEYFLFPVVVDSHAHFIFPFWWLTGLLLHRTWEWSTRFSTVLPRLLPSIQVKITFNKQEYSQIHYHENQIYKSLFNA